MMKENNRKKVVFISCFDAYDDRIKYIERTLEKKGYDAVYITSNFDHRKKEFYKINRENSIQIETLEYKRNFSIRRLLSHVLFSKQAIKCVSTIQPDMLYIMLPPNILAYFASKYKKKYNPKLFFDIYDLWPETFPSKKYKKILSIPFSIWGGIRNQNLKYADVVVTECDLFRSKLQDHVGKAKTITLYPLKISKIRKDRNKIILDDKIDMCYLGSINNIIDIDSISTLLGKVNKIKPVHIHIIGNGEKRKEFVEALEKKDIKVYFYGQVYDDTLKQEIFDKCVLGINMMKDTACVGLTLKSIDYINAGLPLLNNIKGDTSEMVINYGIGINVGGDLEKTVNEIISLDSKKMITINNSIERLYREKFSYESFECKLQEMFDL